MNIPELISEKFIDVFGTKPLLVRSPGRVNLIGEHTDYNDGFVLPAAIDKAIYFAIAPRKDYTCRLIAVDMKDEFEFQVSGFSKSVKGWPDYLMGVVDQLKRNGYEIKGFNCVFGGEIPIGAGLSSSAAIEAGLIFALNNIFGLGMEKIEMVKLAQKAENEFVGVKCGIMDQYINIFGKKDNVLQIDCRSLEFNYYPFEFENVSVILFDTRVSHSLASSEYNKRRIECSLGVELLKKYDGGIGHLRDVSPELLLNYEKEFDPVVYKRCRYVVEENKRLLDACASLQSGDLKKFGELMYETHYGLSRDYEVSCDELDYLVELTRNNPAVYGSRMMGGGFGGCTINLIENAAVYETIEKVKKSYAGRFGREPWVYITKISGGTEIIAERLVESK